MGHSISLPCFFNPFTATIIMAVFILEDLKHVWTSYVRWRECVRLRSGSLFSRPVEQNARDTQMTTRVTDGARRERHVSRVAAQRARVHSPY